MSDFQKEINDFMTQVKLKNGHETEFIQAQDLLESKVNQLKENLVQEPVSQIKSNLKFISNYSKEEYFSIISKAKKYIKEGDIFLLLLSIITFS